MNDAELKYWLGFNLVNGIGPARVQALLDRYGSLERAWSAADPELSELGFDQRALEGLREARLRLDLERELARLRQAGVQLLTWESEGYPRLLREVPGRPPLLYVAGELLEVDEWAVAVVGTRRLTHYGRQVARDLVSGLVSSQITIVSGLANGIDTVAHETALDQGGRTIAVLGSGPNVIYPPENRALAKRILAGRGALVSEYGLDVKPEAHNFPPRNRIISGLSLGVVIVEAGEKSGALITANFALEQNREVLAVPGNISSPASRGTNRLIQQGAKLVSRVEDVLEELNLRLAPQQMAVQRVLPETAEEARLLSLLSFQPLHIDELSRQAEMPSSAVSSALTVMELKGMVQQVGGMNYVLREPGPDYRIG
ncbi:MAG: DNA-processing protein DprA [Candidatus Promineifilaceae bacterium]